MAKKKEKNLLYDLTKEGPSLGQRAPSSGSAPASFGSTLSLGNAPASFGSALSLGNPSASYESAFSLGNAPDYKSRYQSKIDALADSLLNREAFRYSPEEDPAYLQYAEAYQKEGKRAMQDTLGQLSARTGGLASSYAGAAAQQSYENYMASLADKIPELKQLAYSMYLDESNARRSDLELLGALEQRDLDRYRTQLNKYNADRDFSYGVYSDDWDRSYKRERDKLADTRYDTERAYELERDKLADSRYDAERAYELERDRIEDAQRAAARVSSASSSKSASTSKSSSTSKTSGSVKESAAYDDVVKLAEKKAKNGFYFAIDYVYAQADARRISRDEADYIVEVILGLQPRITPKELPMGTRGNPLSREEFERLKKKGDNSVQSFLSYEDYSSEIHYG